MIGARKRRQGFTLIELLIVAAVFSIAALMATTVFSNIQTTQRTVQSQQRTSTDGRYVLETIARSVRTGTVNYSIYQQGVAPTLINGLTTPTISTVDPQNIYTCYRLFNGKVQVWSPATFDCLLPVATDWASFTPDDIIVEELNFFVGPPSNPFRPQPRLAGDCALATPVTEAGAIVAGFDAAKGACTCRQTVTGVSGDCFASQGCQSTVNTGLNCDFSSGVSEADCTCKNPNQQPQVTIFLKSRSVNQTQGGHATSTLQTTVVSRVYQR